MCGPASPVPSVPRVLISAASKSGRSSRRLSAAYDPPGNPGLLSRCLGDRMFYSLLSAMGWGGAGGRNSDSFDSADHVLFLARFWRRRDSALRLSASQIDAVAWDPRSVGLVRIRRRAGLVADFCLDPCAKRSPVDSFG